MKRSTLTFLAFILVFSISSGLYSFALSSEPVDHREVDGVEEQSGDEILGEEPIPDQSIEAEPNEVPVPEPYTRREVKIFSSLTDVISEGEIVHLTSKLEGFDGKTLSYQWQYREKEGVWRDVTGAKENFYDFIATAKTVNYQWRLLVYLED